MAKILGKPWKILWKPLRARRVQQVFFMTNSEASALLRDLVQE
jgi:hypothetical protein